MAALYLFEVRLYKGRGRSAIAAPGVAARRVLLRRIRHILGALTHFAGYLARGLACLTPGLGGGVPSGFDAHLHRFAVGLDDPLKRVSRLAAHACHLADDLAPQLEAPPLPPRPSLDCGLRETDCV